MEQLDELRKLLGCLKGHREDIETIGRYAMHDEENRRTVAQLNLEIEQVEAAIRRLLGED